MIKKVLVIGVTMVLALAMLTACGNANKEANKVIINGSTSVEPLSKELAKVYMESNDKVEIEVKGTSSSQAISELQNNMANIGALSREVKASEKGAVKNQYEIARDGIAVIVNKDVKVDSLTLEQIRKIFSGEIKNWKDVGGNDAKIAVITREEGSGTRAAFGEITKVVLNPKTENEVDKTTSEEIIQNTTEAVKEAVKSTTNSIGYVSLYATDDTVKVLEIDKVKISPQTIIEGKYPLTRPFIYVTGADETEDTKAFIDWVLTKDGQDIVKQMGFVPVK